VWQHVGVAVGIMDKEMYFHQVTFRKEIFAKRKLAQVRSIALLCYLKNTVLKFICCIASEAVEIWSELAFGRRIFTCGDNIRSLL
jgi:hypothetical protein